jgi:flagellar protein FliO/FliZ
MLRSRPLFFGRISNTTLAFVVSILLICDGKASIASDVIKKTTAVAPTEIQNKKNNLLNSIVTQDSSIEKKEIVAQSHEVKENESKSTVYEIPKQVELSGRIIQVTIGLALVLAAIFAVSWLAKRYGRFPSLPTNKFKILASISVGQRERVLLFQIGEQQLLLGVTAQSVQVLHKLDESIQSVDDSKKREPILSFSRRLQDELNDRVPQ